MGNNNAKTTKYVAMITYIVAVICLILGLFLPLGNLTTVSGKDSILALQLPNALGTLLNKEIGKGSAFTYSYAINFLGLMADGKTIDLGAILVLLYTAVTALGILMLIPVLACRRTSRVAIKTASFIEVVALLFLATLVLIELTKFSALGLAFGVSDKWSYALLIAFGGTLLMLIIQAFVYKKGSGIFKFFLFLLSAVAVLATMFPVTLIITQLATPVDKLAESFKLSSGLYGAGGLEGISQLVFLFSVKYFDVIGGLSTLNKLLTVSTLILAALVFVNFMCDMMGLGKKTNRAMLVCNVIRYVLEVIAVILVFVAILVLKDPEIKIGIMLVLLAIIAVLQLIIDIIRLCRIRRKKGRKAKEKKEKREKTKKEKKSEPAEVYTPVYAAPVYAAASTEKVDDKASKRDEKRAEKEARKAEAAAQAEAEAARKAAEKAAEKAAKKAAKEESEYVAPAPSYTTTPAQTVKKAEANGQPVYNVETLYNGPIDDFIRKLSNQERIEFAQVFLERARCPLTNVPDYVVGGNNAKFFSSVFIYYGRIRDYVSDGLMNKIYEECNLM